MLLCLLTPASRHASGSSTSHASSGPTPYPCTPAPLDQTLTRAPQACGGPTCPSSSLASSGPTPGRTSRTSISLSSSCSEPPSRCAKAAHRTAPLRRWVPREASSSNHRSAAPIHPHSSLHASGVPQAGPVLDQFDFNTGNSTDEAATRALVQLLDNSPVLLDSCQQPFDEGLLWQAREPSERALLEKQLQVWRVCECAL